MGTPRQQNVDMQVFHDPMAVTDISATSTIAIETAQRPFRIDAAELISDVTVPSSGTNFYAFNLRVGGRSVATFTVNGNAITAGTPAQMTLVAESGSFPTDNCVANTGEVVDCVATLTGALSITNLRIVVHGRYVG